MLRRPPSAARIDTLVPYSRFFRSGGGGTGERDGTAADARGDGQGHGGRPAGPGCHVDARRRDRRRSRGPARGRNHGGRHHGGGERDDVQHGDDRNLRRYDDRHRHRHLDGHGSVGRGRRPGDGRPGRRRRSLRAQGAAAPLPWRTPLANAATGGRVRAPTPQRESVRHPGARLEGCHWSEGWAWGLWGGCRERRGRYLGEQGSAAALAWGRAWARHAAWVLLLSPSFAMMVGM